jgi:hypothetical protein
MLEGPAKISSFLRGTPIGFFKLDNHIRAGKNGPEGIKNYY